MGETIGPPRLAEAVARLRAADPGFAAFGAEPPDGHGYVFRPVAAVDEIAAVEGRFGIQLPEDYRRFLLKVGNGGAGPGYGLFPLGCWDGRGGDLESWLEPEPSDWHPVHPELAWRHEQAFAIEDMDIGAEPEPTDDDEAWQAWTERRDAVWDDPGLLGGALPLTHHGCAIRSWLVVNGPAHGTVWMDDLANNDAIAPELAADGTPHTFTTGYLAWLDETALEIEDASSA